VLLGSAFAITTITDRKFILLIASSARSHPSEESGPSHVPIMGIDYDE